MTQEEIIEGNKLIAEFVQKKTVINECEYCGEDVTDKPLCKGDKDGNKRTHALGGRLVELKYHSSWNWLMVVVEKIQKLENCRFYFHVDPFSIMCVDYKNEEKDIFILEFTSEDDCLKMRYYQAVLKFIKWYNQQTKATIQNDKG